LLSTDLSAFAWAATLNVISFLSIYRNYALQNRAEWEDRGQEIVEELVQEMLYHRSPRNSFAGSAYRRRGSMRTEAEEKKSGTPDVPRGIMEEP